VKIFNWLKSLFVKKPALAPDLATYFTAKHSDYELYQYTAGTLHDKPEVRAAERLGKALRAYNDVIIKVV
jgi:hypothetical protein